MRRLRLLLGLTGSASLDRGLADSLTGCGVEGLADGFSAEAGEFDEVNLLVALGYGAAERGVALLQGGFAGCFVGGDDRLDLVVVHSRMMPNRIGLVNLAKPVDRLTRLA